MGFFTSLMETIDESMKAYNADMQQMKEAKETYNRLAKKYHKPVITTPTTTNTSSRAVTKVPEPVSFESYIEAHRFLLAGRYVYQSVDIWKKGNIIARGKRVSSSSYMVTFHEL